jgi:hypothetical protein
VGVADGVGVAVGVGGVVAKGVLVAVVVGCSVAVTTTVILRGACIGSNQTQALNKNKPKRMTIGERIEK